MVHYHNSPDNIELLDFSWMPFYIVPIITDLGGDSQLTSDQRVSSFLHFSVRLTLAVNVKTAFRIVNWYLHTCTSVVWRLQLRMPPCVTERVQAEWVDPLITGLAVQNPPIPPVLNVGVPLSADPSSSDDQALHGSSLPLVWVCVGEIRGKS